MIAFLLLNLPYCVKKFKSRKNLSRDLSLIFFHRYVQPSLMSKTFSKSSLKLFTIDLCIIAAVFLHIDLHKVHLSHISLCSLVWVDVIVYYCRLTAILPRPGCQEGGRDTPAPARPVCRVSQCPGPRYTKLASSHQSQPVTVCPRPLVRDFSH